MLLLLGALTTARTTAAVRVRGTCSASRLLHRLRGNPPRQVGVGRVRRLVLLKHVGRSVLLLLSDLTGDLEELCGALRVEHRGTLTKLADHCFESILILSGLLLKV